jgi:hypothetical protein
MRRLIALTCVTAAILVAAAPVGAEPSDGNGNQTVIAFDEAFEIPCDGGLLDVHVGGWVSGRSFQGAGNRNLELAVYHAVITYTNPDGETWTYRDVGPDHFYLDANGDLILTINGRPGNPLGEGSLNGHAVVNLTTGDIVAVRGNQGPLPDDAACEALG